MSGRAFLVADTGRLAALDERIETVCEEDLAELAALTQRALRGTVDESAHDDTYREEQLHGFWHGDQGEPIWDAMLLIRRDSRPVSFALTSRLQGIPFICYLMTDPDAQGEGLGTALLGSVAARLREAGHPEVGLRVTIANPAYEFYLRRGFTVRAA